MLKRIWSTTSYDMMSPIARFVLLSFRVKERLKQGKRATPVTNSIRATPVKAAYLKQKT